MTTVEDLRQELMNLGLTEEEANNIKGKSNLSNKLEELKVKEETVSLFDEVEEQEEVALDNSKPVITQDELSPEAGRPLMTDPGWSDYVLGHLEENEKIKGHPKADSLRRLTELLVGEIINIDTQVPQCPSMENGGRATVIVTVEIRPYFSNSGYMRASGAADVFPLNTAKLFAQFPVATAETRAEGRAYRKILKLISVVTAEEVVDENDIFDPNDRINESQIQTIKHMCGPNKLNINVEKLLNQYDINLESIENISKSKAQEICKVISSYQETGVPEELIGYKSDWR